MKHLNLFLTTLALGLTTLLLTDCDMLWDDRSSSSLNLSFDESIYSATKASSSLPDTNSFILSVRDASGKPVYEGRYGDSPEKIMVSPGSYTVNVKSADFIKPAFDSPQYGDTQVVSVSSRNAASVKLMCRQINSGIKLKTAPDFLKSYPNGALFLKSAEGKLLYSYSERRIAYFKPGSVSLMLTNNGKDEILMSRTLEAQDVLLINVSAPSSSGSSTSEHISIQLDTTRNWTVENYVIGSGSDKGKEKDSAMSVAEARKSSGEKEVWVYGYIVGGNLTSSGAAFSGPFSSRTNILLGSRSSSSDKSTCLSVKLSQGSIRDALNLVDNPQLIGHAVYLKGDLIEAYYGIPGIQNISDYRLVEQ